MIIKQLIDEDFVNYKLPSMYIGFPKCTFKCEKECGLQVCQNGVLATSPTISIDADKLVSRYVNNFIASSVVIAGLEPFDSFNDLVELISKLRIYTDDDIVIYTGYYKSEIQQYINIIKQYKNIIVKFGRYIPNQQPHKDEILGVNLASNNQYAEKIS
jgi:organic radical activating enzyme